MSAAITTGPTIASFGDHGLVVLADSGSLTIDPIIKRALVDFERGWPCRAGGASRMDSLLIPNSFEGDFQELTALAESIAALIPVDRNEQFVGLARSALQALAGEEAQRMPVEDWAERLINDVGDATD